MGGHPLPQPGAGPPRWRRCRSRGAAPAAAWKVSRRFWGALPPHRRRRPPCARGPGEGAGGAGAPRNAAAGSPPPVPYPLFPTSVTPFGRAGGGWVRRTTFWERVGGGFGGAGKPSECPPPAPEAAGTWGAGPAPGAGNEGQGRGAALAAPSLPGTCRGWRLSEPCRGRAGGSRPPHCPRSRYRDGSRSPLAPQPGQVASVAPTRQGLCLAPLVSQRAPRCPCGLGSCWGGSLCEVLLPPRTANERILFFREKNVW